MSSSASVALLSIGDELLAGRLVDTNAPWLARALVAQGLQVVQEATVGDDRAAIAEAIERLSMLAPHVITTGGLGPTDDDLTRFAAADLRDGGGIIDDAEALVQIQSWCTRRGLPASEACRAVAQRPASARFLPNAHGTAPGMHLDLGHASVWLLPGPPGEMCPMFEASVSGHLPAGRATPGGEVLAVGLTEVQAAQLLGDRLRRDQVPRMGIRVGGGLVRVLVDDPTRSLDPERVREVVEEVRTLLSPWSLPIRAGGPAAVLGAELTGAGETLATAESCTGGSIGAALTSVPGSSGWYVGGWVTYSNAMKQAQLDVPGALLEPGAAGAVSAEVAAAMAAGARTRSGASMAVAVTGIAGPDGGTPEKPVGTAWLGLAGAAGTATRLIQVSGDRSQIRRGTVLAALQWTRWHRSGVDARLCWDVGR